MDLPGLGCTADSAFMFVACSHMGTVSPLLLARAPLTHTAPAACALTVLGCRDLTLCCLAGCCQFLEAYISPRVAHLGHVGTAVKIAFDFCTIGPPLIFSFLYWSKLWESRFDHDVTLRHTLDRYPSTLLASYAFWAPLHFATYGLVPLRHRCADRVGPIFNSSFVLRTSFRLKIGLAATNSLSNVIRDQDGMGLGMFSGLRCIAVAL